MLSHYHSLIGESLVLNNIFTEKDMISNSPLIKEFFNEMACGISIDKQYEDLINSKSQYLPKIFLYMLFDRQWFSKVFKIEDALADKDNYKLDL